MKKIKDIIDVDLDIEIKGVVDDSREVKDGYLFVATNGFNVDHFDYIEDAINNGAVFVICDREIYYDVPYFVVEADVDINDFYIECCCKFFDVDLEKFKFIGITGTDGKTTTANIIYQLLEDCAYIGTNGVIINNQKHCISNTTPCVSELYMTLKKIQDSKCKFVSMEVSSEALLHNRVNNIFFERIGYTNITEDHLNIHGTVEEYRNSKFKLLNHMSDNSRVFINGDDDNCLLLKNEFFCKYGFGNNNDYVIKNVKITSNFVKFDIVDKSNFCYEICSPLYGKYNIYNVTLAFLICLSLGINYEVLYNKIKNLDVIEGRCEFLNFGQTYNIVLDYAHTYNSISNILNTFSHYKNIIVVTGAAGGREKEKRSKIGKLILDKSSIAIFTMDDPRNESVDDIIDDLIGEDTRFCYRINNRKDAIYKAFELADDDSIVLIIGKGRDNYMAIGDKKIEYCDYEVIKNYFEK